MLGYHNSLQLNIDNSISKRKTEYRFFHNRKLTAGKKGSVKIENSAVCRTFSLSYAASPNANSASRYIEILTVPIMIYRRRLELYFGST